VDPSMCVLPSYMVYWRDPGPDCGVRPPLYCRPTASAPRKYVTFEPDQGGWNNIRMAAEAVMVFAMATGRTLVLPPPMRMYLLNKNKKPVDNKSEFATFFHLERLHDVLDMVTMKQFFQESTIPPPPNGVGLWKHLSQRAHVGVYAPSRKFAAYGYDWSLASSSDHRDCPVRPSAFGALWHGSKAGRLKRFTLGRRSPYTYNAQLHEHPVIHFPGNYSGSTRMLVHFYAWNFFQDPAADRFYKRVMRDRVRYRDEIFCAAAAMVKHLVGEAKKQPGEVTGYAAFHIRRGDFQFKAVRIPIADVLKHTEDLLRPGQLVYIATDVKDFSEFEPFTSKYDVRFFRPVADAAGLHFVDSGEPPSGPEAARVLNLNHIGMIEQVVCANAEVFVGTPFSTFTGYITRLRGYAPDKRNDSFYYMPNRKYAMRRSELSSPLWAREFGIAWQGIDE